jgi:sensor histidine kinase YesM
VRKWIYIVLFCIHSLSWAQEYQLKRFEYNQSNSGFTTNTGYHWTQSEKTGRVWVSGNSGIFRFDGKIFYPYRTVGRAKPISSLVYDSKDRLWANNFYGDIFYLQKDTFIKHPFSQKNNELTTFQKLNNRFFLRTEQKIYEINTEDLNISLIDSFSLIRTLFSYQNKVYGICQYNDESVKIIDLDSGQGFSINNDFVNKSRCRFLQSPSGDYLFFEDANKLISVTNFIDGNAKGFIDIPFEGKINYASLVDKQLVLCGPNGLHFFSLDGVFQKQLLNKTQITHFGKDLEGNYLATTHGNGLLLIPNIHAFLYDYSKYLDNESILKSIYKDDYLIHATSAGKLIKHQLTSHKISVLNFGKRCETLSISWTSNKKNLLVYCDQLYEIDFKYWKIINSHNLSSIKNILALHDYTILGTRKGFIKWDRQKLEDNKEIGWNIDLCKDEQRQIVYISTKKGIFMYRTENKVVTQIYFSSLKKSAPTNSLESLSSSFSFLHNNTWLKTTDFITLDTIYHSNTRTINACKTLKDHLYVFMPTGVIQLDKKYQLVNRFSTQNGLNSRLSKTVFENKNQLIFTHKTSISVLPILETQKRIKPELSFQPISNFNSENNHFVLAFHQNNLHLKLEIHKALRLRGQFEIFYRLNEASFSWKKLEAPLDNIQVDRLPIGKGQILFKAVNINGEESDVLPVHYQVDPPYYLQWWFVLLIFAFVFFLIWRIILWREGIIRKKALLRLQKKQLETRALKAELTAIRSQMNPHFIFNVLTAIQAKVIEGKTKEAYQNIGDFADLIRNILDKSGKEYIYLKEEIILMRNYVELENSRVEIPVKLIIIIDDSDFFDHIEIPSLLTQPMIENSIRHAFNKSDQNKIIEIKTQRSSNGFSLTVSDNGKGFGNETKRKETHQPFALKAIKKRIENISQQSTRYHIELQTSTSEKGTRQSFLFTFK